MFGTAIDWNNPSTRVVQHKLNNDINKIKEEIVVVLIATENRRSRTKNLNT
jgi:hypothetical protein